MSVPAGGVYKIAPVTLPSDRVLFLEEGSSLVGSDRWQDYGVTRFLPPMGTEQQLRPLLSGTCLQTRSTPAPILIPSAKLLVALQRLICGHMLPLPPPHLHAAVNASNITITGRNGTIDGNGWFA